MVEKKAEENKEVKKKNAKRDSKVYRQRRQKVARVSPSEDDERMADAKKEKREDISKEAESKFLVPLNQYLATGIHIGMRARTKDMEKFIYRVRQDKLAVFDISKVDERIRLAANLLSTYDPKDILVVSRKRNGHKPVYMFAKATGAHYFYGRFMPGTLTNPNYEKYIEPKVIVITDPFADSQAFQEAIKSNITIIAMCDTFDQTKYIDLVIPMNNKGRRSVALVYYLLAKEYLKLRGEIKDDEEFPYKLKDFEMPVAAKKNIL